jgi:hypothetical protein
METDTELMAPRVVEPGAAPEDATAPEDAAGDWLCAWCQHRVAREKDRFAFDGKDEFTFSNPARIRFALIIFSRTLGCRESGVPTLEHTWFPAHARSYCLCANRGQPWAKKVLQLMTLTVIALPVRTMNKTT